MKKKDAKLTEAKYAELKNRVYKIYLYDLYHPEENKIQDLFVAASKLNNESVNEIVGDTIEFPYDKELYDFYNANKSLNVNDLILKISEKFGIDNELIISKIREYTFYRFDKLLDDNLLNKDYVSEISRLYMTRNEEKNK